MRRIYIFIWVLLGVLTCVSCNSAVETEARAGGGEIRFTASMGGFSVKAGDTYFDYGDEIGLYATYPVERYDVRLTASGSELIPDSKIYWGQGQTTEKSTFAAYYPYDPTFVPTRYNDWTVAQDQRTYLAYTHSDLMGALTQASPEDGIVHFEFYHMLSKMAITVENNLDDAVTSVVVGNLALTTSVNTATDFTYYSTESKDYGIAACHVTTVEGGDEWWLILPPQTTTPEIIIGTESGQQYSFIPDDELTFGQGMKTRGYISLNENSISADFTANVNDWGLNADVIFQNQGAEDDDQKDTGTYLPSLVSIGGISYDDPTGAFNTECQLAWNKDRIVISNGYSLFWWIPDFSEALPSAPSFTQAQTPCAPTLVTSDDEGNVIIIGISESEGSAYAYYSEDITAGQWTGLDIDIDMDEIGTAGRIAVTGNILEKAVMTITGITQGEYSQKILAWGLDNESVTSITSMAVEGQSPAWLSTNNGAVPIGDTPRKGFYFHAYADGLRSLLYLPDQTEVLSYDSLMDGNSANCDFTALDIAWYKGHRFLATAPGEFFTWSNRVAYLFNADRPESIEYWTDIDTSSVMDSDSYIASGAGSSYTSTSSSIALLVPTEENLIYFILSNSHRKLAWIIFE